MCRSPVGEAAAVLCLFRCLCVNLSLVSPLDCVQFQSDHVQSRVPAGQGVHRPQRWHLGPQRHQDTARGAGHSICRYGTRFISGTSSFICSPNIMYAIANTLLPSIRNGKKLLFIYHVFQQTTLRCCGALKLGSASSNIWAIKDQVEFRSAVKL